MVNCNSRLPVVVLLLLFLFAPKASRLGAQAQAEVRRNDVAYQFGQRLRFTLEVNSETDIHVATLLFSTPDMPNTLTLELPQQPTREMRLVHEVEVTSLPLKPFSELSWRWVLLDESGNSIELPEKTVVYRDDRFLWSSLTRGDWTVYWVDGDVSLGQMVLDLIAQTLPRLQAIIPSSAPKPLRIFLYPTNSDLQEALRLTGFDWVGGHASPQLDAILIALPALTTAESELRRVVPHELAHLMLAEATHPSSDTVAAWFDEGLATYFEWDESIAYQRLLQEAIDANRTIPLAELCLTFPTSEDLAFLAYIQSGSVVEWIQSAYGNHALTELILAFGDGLGCEAAVLRVLGLSVAQTDAAWRDANASRPAFERMLRQHGWWLVLAGAGFLSVLLLVWTPSPVRKHNSPW